MQHHLSSIISNFIIITENLEVIIS